MYTSTLSLLLATAATIRGLPFTPEKRQNATEPGAGSKLIPVVVGGVQDLFIPNRVVATPGDVIQFQFNSGNHTVTQSTADAACQPMEGGVHSGHIPFQDGQQTVGVFNMLVTNTDTMFLYCATGPHCQGAQVMIVNPANEQQILDYANKATASGSSVDGTDVVGGTVGDIPLANAAFVPVAQEEGAGAPPPPPPSATSAAAEEPAATPEAPAAAPEATSTAAAEEPVATPAPAAPEAGEPAAADPAATPEASAPANVPAVLQGLIGAARRSV
ncbi:hypothetical protein B0J11DRAFT_268278 [Dendryphion nanum]|uniref:Extracellular serine-rich protein n=1 Tax=Dendryphion nanum TaxID=256645 RepID=A0A9P9DXL8_9PLEO|nr:hypothetical protein B0J11DRAFT_268278 [Dendryphion nanum]